MGAAEARLSKVYMCKPIGWRLNATASMMAIVSIYWHNCACGQPCLHADPVSVDSRIELFLLERSCQPREVSHPPLSQPFPSCMYVAGLLSFRIEGIWAVR